MFELKPIAKASIAQALQKAERYRIINDPSSAESICLDVLQVDPENQEALVTLLLAITDQFTEGPTEGVHRAQGLLPSLHDGYKRAYDAGQTLVDVDELVDPCLLDGERAIRSHRMPRS